MILVESWVWLPKPNLEDCDRTEFQKFIQQ